MLKNLKSLVVLDLGNNNISGAIPLWIRDNNPMLKILKLRSNRFCGSIPWQLSQLPHLQLLDLAENNFVGSIPRSFVNFSSMRQTFVMQPAVTTDMVLITGNLIVSYNGSMDILWKGREYTLREDMHL